MTPQDFAVASAGRILPIQADERLSMWWPDIAPHIPGAAPTLLRSHSDLRTPVDLAQLDNPAEVRRAINAYLHRLHLECGTLCVHGVALAAPGGGACVMLLGGHGAGKTLVATALALKGWAVVAGDTALIDATCGRSRLLGGTHAFVVRTSSTAHWFPHLLEGANYATQVADVRHRLPRTARPMPLPIASAVLVHVDGDPLLSEAVIEPVAPHTAASVWWRASAHLVDRFSDSQVLRLLEDPPSAQRRRDLVHATAAGIPLTTAWGSPHGIAAAVEAAAPLGKAIPEERR